MKNLPTKGLAGMRLAAALAIAALLAPASARAADPPTSWNYPLLPHVHGLAFQPSQPSDDQVTSVVLSAVYSGECWRLVSFARSDPNHVSVTLALDETCGGDSVSGWVQEIELGSFAAGIVPLTVLAKLARAGADTTFEERTIGFEVIHGDTPPPPPPPGPSDSTNTTVLSIEVVPAAPDLDDPVTVRLRGRYPFDCGFIASSAVSDTNLSLTLGRLPACADTNHAWTHEYELGVLPVGTTTFMLDVAAERANGTTHELHGIPVTVIDPDAPPPPPPPPVDSLESVLSKSHPNPFHDEARFSVSVMEPRRAEVAIFDLSGRRVATVFRGTLPAGTSQLAWNGRRADGSRAPGGIYFYRLTLPERIITRRVVLLGTP